MAPLEIKVLYCFCVGFCRIISTCGELLRQCGAFEQQLSNKYDYLFSFHKPRLCFGLIDFKGQALSKAA